MSVFLSSVGNIDIFCCCCDLAYRTLLIIIDRAILSNWLVELETLGELTYVNCCRLICDRALNIQPGAAISKAVLKTIAA